MEPTSPVQPAAPEKPVARPPIVDTIPDHRIVPLNGYFERNRFHPLLTALLLVILSFVVFQGVAAVVMAVLVSVGMIREGRTDLQPDELMAELLGGNPEAVLIGNTVGQFVGMGFLVWGWTRLHSKPAREFVRVRRADVLQTVYSVIGLLLLMPVVQWLGPINEALPLPEGWKAFEAQQVQLVESIVTNADLSLALALFALAVTPGLCEELMFRGYLQRQVERVGGPVWAMVSVGIFFGLYHLRLTQAIPLSLIGVYLGFVLWRTGSLWPAIIVHFLNNALLLILVRVAMARGVDLETVESTPIPWYLAFLSALGVAGIVVLMNRRADRLLSP
ncbi:MAG: CPBP family intramembrane glutamic endopeptidase [Bacteroidota bacterium]